MPEDEEASLAEAIEKYSPQWHKPHREIIQFSNYRIIAFSHYRIIALTHYRTIA
jgi:hypothetical protein